MYCNREAIACIKLTNNPTYYSIGSAQSWNNSEAGKNITYLSENRINFTLPKSILINGNEAQNSSFQLIFVFTFFQDNESLLIQVSQFNYLRLIFNSNIYKNV